MAVNYKHLYEQMKKMVVVYQDEVVPGMREQLEKRVEVVRCKDCSVPHNEWTGCPKLNGLVTPPDFYCGFGERREENDAD